MIACIAVSKTTERKFSRKTDCAGLTSVFPSWSWNWDNRNNKPWIYIYLNFKGFFGSAYLEESFHSRMG